MNALVRRASALVRHQLEMQGIELVEGFAPALPPCLCDADQIQQVVLVLLVNAVEAMPRGGRMEITTGLDSSGSAIEVQVRDDGTGIAEDVLPHIFEPFFTTKEDQHRTGLGLAVARNIVERHAGTLEASSTPEQGTEFTLALPLERRTEMIDDRA